MFVSYHTLTQQELWQRKLAYDEAHRNPVLNDACRRQEVYEKYRDKMQMEPMTVGEWKA